ncbi:MAG: hypothetical protein D6747_06045 [Chlorobiota bacterium]|jgi:hypothetical protein|nr:MAG: hypothetical protein D6747_06045 [Chlorobiota bacterium]
MKTRLLFLTVLAIALWSCADPSSVTDPIVENPKPVERTILPEHLDEASGDDRFLSGGDGQEYEYALANAPDELWSRQDDRSSIVLDTVHGRILHLRLSLIPKAKSWRDTLELRVRRFTLELDSTANLFLDRGEKRLFQGEAAFYLREAGMNGWFYRTSKLTSASPEIPLELRDSVFCRVRLWRNSRNAIVFTLTVQHFVVINEQGQQRKVRRLRLSALLEIPLAR